MKIKVLAVDDEEQIRRFLRASFMETEYQVIEAESVAEAIRRSATERPDLILLDLGLPDGDGKDVVKSVREWSSTPIIILSARGDEDEKVAALNLGADDYLTKPFSSKELEARMKAALRRTANTEAGDPSIKFGDVEVNLNERHVTKSEKFVKLTPLEYQVLSCLVKHRDKVVTQRRLLREVWGPEYEEESHYLRVYMRNLRRKLETEPANPQHIITEPGVGYRLITAG